MVRWPRRIDWVGLYKSSDHPSSWIFRCLEFQVWEANFCWLISGHFCYCRCCFPTIRTAWFVFSDTSIACGLKQLQQNMCFNTGLGNKRREHRSRQMLFWPADRGVCSLHQFLGFSSAMEDAASLEDATSSIFLGLDQRKVPWNLAFFKRELHDQRRCETGASITESRDAGMVMNVDSVIYARLNRSENGRADSITIEERSTEKSCKRKDRRWTLGWDSSTVTRDSGARFESS